MKKILYVLIAAAVAASLLPGCSPKSGSAGSTPPAETADAGTSDRVITEDMAFEGVNSYCRSTYDWSAAEDNPDIMYVEKGEETETEYQVIFRSYTGSYVYFYVDKTSGTTRMVEYVPALDTESEAGTFDLFEYLETDS